ncbi:MAG: ABC transporter permease subunit [Euryarchaeota archaeon]|nr:ABC transporter permease subunit [Euryarchaeota archaeon]
MIVTRKEFMDHISGKRFLVIFAVLLLLTSLSLYNGVKNYHGELDEYKRNLSSIDERKAEYERNIKKVEKEDPEQAEQMRDYMLDFMPHKPSVLRVFQEMHGYFTVVGLILALALGFDLISQEKETGSLKSLLSHPVFRDSVLNGKILGALMALGFAMVIVSLLSVGVLMSYGLIPTRSEILRMSVFMLLSLLFLLSYFSIGFMSSTLGKNSGQSILIALGLFVLLTIGLPIAGELIADTLVEESPDPQFSHTSSSYEKREQIRVLFFMASPAIMYDEISRDILRPPSPGGRGMILRRTIQNNWQSLISLTVLPVPMFVISYLRFMRMDIR